MNTFLTKRTVQGDNITMVRANSAKDARQQTADMWKCKPDDITVFVIMEGVNVRIGGQ
jgi:hypothetical protein